MYKDQYNSHQGYWKYIRNTVINNYPYKCFGDFNDENESTSIKNNFSSSAPNIRKLIQATGMNESRWNEWIAAVFSATKRTSRIAKLPLDLSCSSTTIAIRSKRIFDLASVMHFLSKAYRKHDGPKINGNVNKPSNSAYGNKYAMCGFMGNEVIRKYPYKDVIGFMSVQQKLCADKQGGHQCLSRYEHWTPTGIFAKTIAIEQLSVMDLGDWFKFLYQFYRTVRITIEEDSKLEKSLRPINQYQDKEIGIEIAQLNEWNKLHDVNDAVAFLESNEQTFKIREDLISSLLR